MRDEKRDEKRAEPPSAPPGELRAADADIALLLEGTFPYVSGGVSSWVNQVIRAFPEYRFALVFIGSRNPTTAR